jgi:ATP-binding cassette subfamily F protein 3
VLVSHDRHLLRATTDQFLIVADGRMQPFDGDLDDYRDWMFKTKLAGETAVPLPSAPIKTPDVVEKEVPREDRREQKKREAAERQRLADARKPIESRIKRLEDQIAKLTAKKATIDARMADPAIYGEDAKEALKELVVDQAFVAKELVVLEEEWLAQQQRLEELAA